MSTRPADPPESGAVDSGPERLAAVIGRNVLAALGRPGDFLRVTVRRITGDGHRVNVVTGPDPSSARIAHSFFVTADNNGNVTRSSPTIVRQY